MVSNAFALIFPRLPNVSVTIEIIDMEFHYLQRDEVTFAFVTMGRRCDRPRQDIA